MDYLRAFLLGGALVGIGQYKGKGRTIHVECKTVFDQPFQRKRKLIQEFVTKQMTVLQIDAADVFQIDQEHLEVLPGGNPLLDFPEEAVPVIQLGQ